MSDSAGPVVARYTDAFGRETTVSPQARRAVLEAMEVDGGGPPAAGAPEPVRLARPGAPLGGRADLVLEDGTALGAVTRLPADLPHGYHRLQVDGREQLLLVPPPRCVAPPRTRGWAWCAQLPSVRSRASWGIGDLADLRALAAWSAGLGAAAIVVSPLGAPNPDPQPEASPYYPSTRRFRNPLLLRIEEVAGAAADPAVAGLAAEARRLNEQRLIDRAEVQRLKLRALQALWDRASRQDDAGFAAYRAEQGDALRGWATFAAIAEVHRGGWRAWPEELRRPASSAVAAFATAHADRIAFHEWVQWLLDEQLRRAAAAGPGLIADLPIGFDPGGFDAWAWREVLSASASIGAPADRFNPAGQDWGLPPFIPHRLREAQLAPFIQTVRAAMRHAGGLRIDHVLGLFRLWWIPASPRDAGAYVRYPADELLAVLAIESERANAIVIGEDLGTVEHGVRRSLARHGLLSTRLAYFEPAGLGRIPRRVFAAVTTHDLPTVAGAWTGADLDDTVAAGMVPDRNGLGLLQRRIARTAGLGPDAAPREAILAVHAGLAASPAALVGATLEDALAVVERPNLPGTVSAQRPNWSLALPTPLEEIRRDPFVRRLAAILANRGAARGG